MSRRSLAAALAVLLTTLGVAGQAAATPRSPATCAVSVARFVTPRSPDDTAAFTAAMAAAVATHPACFRAGPSGAPQAVVYVPPGTYRLDGLDFVSNVRMEVDAGATLQHPADRAALAPGQASTMINWDSPVIGAPALRNISLVGVGKRMTPLKQAAQAASRGALAGFDLAHSFTMQLDPTVSGSTNYNPALQIVNADWFLVQNVFSVQNATDQPASDPVAWPTSARAAIQLHARFDSPVGGPYLQPSHGVISNHVNVDSPRGYGPNQVNAADHVAFDHIYSQGGTALRIETDGSTNPDWSPDRGATVDQVTAADIVGVDCNRAVSLSPHAQRNGTVRVDGVWSDSCKQAVVAASDASVPQDRVGRFRRAVVSDVHATGGDTAQVDSATMLWDVGPSYNVVGVAPNLTWAPRIRVVQVVGHFVRP